MAKKTKITNYEPPFAKDLSMSFAKGQVSPMGACESGGAPYFNCTSGPGILPHCTPGGTPDLSYCGSGGYHAYPACRTGKNAATICFSGQGQQ
jgi:hypothetical protein